MTPSRIKFYARRFLKGEPIPIFVAKFINFEIDAAVDEIIAHRRAHIWRRKKTKRLMRGNW